MKDDLHQVTGLGPCRHVFGRACVEYLIRVSDSRWLRCPLCRADWCYVSSDDLDRTPPPMSLRHYCTEKQILIYACDYATMRYFLFGEPEYCRDICPIPTDGLSLMVEIGRLLRTVLTSPPFVSKIARLQEACMATLEAPGFDPRAPAALSMVRFWHPFCHAMGRSVRGQCIIEACVDVCNEATTVSEFLGMKDKAIAAAKSEWALVRVEDDGEDFVDMLLEVMRAVIERKNEEQKEEWERTTMITIRHRQLAMDKKD
ncbi:hypothetical protein CC86DRAFT_405860 [Ophiobolus disseminans]|uniref:RING-type domain-containing protein n=1 Tax=Ophiobolus disseminans TaxID=1469910 RepID=A0A6A6ZZU4_9PLEO|nr:hypothetical protein CC86DRAFT_405860 [Ophiobolus disseminans]